MANEKANYDVIIIGAGIGGLTSGLYLQSKNPHLKTIIIEKNNYPGGYVSGFIREGFYFDAAAEAMFNFRNGEINQFFTSVGFNYPFNKIKPFEVFYDTNRVFNLMTEKEKFHKELSTHFPNELNNFEKLITTCQKIIDEAHRGGFTSNKITLTKVIKVLFKYHSLLKFGMRSFEYLLNKFIKNNDLKNYFQLFCMWFGLDMSEISAPVAAFIIGDSFKEGLDYPQGGMDAFVRKLTEFYESKGGIIKYRSQVEKILLLKGKAYGVMLNDGSVIHGMVIISNADLKHTMLDYIGQEYLKKNYVNYIKSLRQSISGLMLYVGTENYDLSKFPPHFYIGPSEKMLENIRNHRFDLSGVAVRIPSNIDPSMQLTNKDSLTVLALAPYNWNDYWQAGRELIRDSEYRKYKDELTEKIITMVEKIMPNLSKHIKMKTLSTPLTFERYNLVTDGAWYGPDYNQKLPSFKTPIKNLFLAGSNTAGSGINNAAGAGLLVGKYVLKILPKKK